MQGDLNLRHPIEDSDTSHPYYNENYGHFADDLKLHGASVANKENILSPVTCDSKPPQVLKSPPIYGKQRVGRARSRQRTISAQVSGPYSINYP
jgi:hypothetical protein